MTRPLSRASQSRRTLSSLDLAAEPLQAGELKQVWIYRQIRARILEGVLAKGARLPSTRHLAERWQVSRATVDLAYDQLRSEGYLVSTAGSGTHVAAKVPDQFFDAGARTSDSPRRRAPGIDVAPLIASAVGKPFVARVADPALFPIDQWRKALQASTRHVTVEQLDDNEPFGLGALRTQIASYLGVARGISCDAEQIVVLAGIRQGLDMCARLLLSPEDKVMVEDPGYLHAAPIFSRHAREVIHVPIDAHGFSVDHARHRTGARLVHVTPAHQAPTGVTMPVSRRLALLAWAEEADCWLIEDDYDSEFSYDSAPLPALKSLDAADRVIHCGSFNKTMFAGLRIGYAVLPEKLVPEFRKARHITGRSTGVIEQLALANFLESGAFARHVRRARLAYAQRRDIVLQALRDALGAERLYVTGAHSGFHLVWWPPPGIDVAALQELAAGHGLRFQAISDFCKRAVLPPGLVIGYAALDDEALRRQAGKLGELISRFRGSASGA
ncbi:PLP-dependent aminotransferase family protein [Variovorax sp. PAMC26660]|uniref:MocR-like pyridoxine biosynthesis transcription factor PdxR n=1 Tax=Variovorax sp. PAMC26660 TaxID=2762322 RepID=UPI00164E9E05|nr:PLP-dependent aminotransferase family protein [Variovorax sp. PAMC26660]QNK69255.1 PLP-dependent aminotransferase family protein [Variovorax sp. PAMC26660]